MTAEERLTILRRQIDNGKVPSWAKPGMSWCPSCDADPKIGHFAHCAVAQEAKR